MKNKSLKKINQQYGQYFCTKPFTEICNTSTEGVKLCCNSDIIITRSERQDNQTLSEIFNSHPKIQKIRKKILNNEPVDACKSCYYHEKINGSSMRTDSIKKIERQNPDLLNKIISSGHSEVVSMDIKFGNKCNLGCVMCEPTSSSLIGKERATNNLPDILLDELSNKKNPKKILYNFNNVDFQDLKTHAHTLRKFSAKGGEPMLLPYYNEWIDYLVENNYSKNISMFTVTNGTIDVSHKVENFSKFKEFEICWSVDAVGQNFNYVRWPASFDKVRKNHYKLLDRVKEKKYQNFQFKFNTVTHSLNVDQMIPIVKYAEELELVKDITFLYAHSPDAMNPGLISENTLENFKYEIENYINENGKFETELEDILNIVTDKWYSIRKDKEKFQNHLRKLKAMTEFWKINRGLDVNDYCLTYRDTISQLKE